LKKHFNLCTIKFYPGHLLVLGFELLSSPSTTSLEQSQN
jgi:hypothetical protein